MRGRKPKPTRLKEIAGNPGCRPLNRNEPQPAVEGLSCPSWLPLKAKREWRRIVPELKRLGLATMVDLAALAAYCVAFGELQEATEILEAEGRILAEPIYQWDKEAQEKRKVGEKKYEHPAVRLQRDALGRVKAFLPEFGLSPSARSRLETNPAQEEPDPLRAFIGDGN
jgi:P27 family predicted phage terminase small subunit